MRTRVLISTVLLLCFSAQAQKGFAPVAVLNKPFVLGLNQQIALKSNGAKLLFVNVLNDSRCPINARCITAGDAEVQFLFWAANSTKSQMISLHTMPNQNTIKLGDLNLQLIDLQPGNVAGGTPKVKKYKAKLKFI